MRSWGCVAVSHFGGPWFEPHPDPSQFNFLSNSITRSFFVFFLILWAVGHDFVCRLFARDAAFGAAERCCNPPPSATKAFPVHLSDAWQLSHSSDADCIRPLSFTPASDTRSLPSGIKVREQGFSQTEPNTHRIVRIEYLTRHVTSVYAAYKGRQRA